ncbi:MAG: glycosyltransferase family 2 protein [Alphaproteobacteria bacterium]|nr:glycosyltransferase family 2 protein [Alphaproteobacteria bacterium]
MKNPKVSVLTPVWNTNPVYLREAIESILSQTFTDFEFILMNNSPENSEVTKILKSYKEKDPRIVYVENESNLGIASSRNKLIDLAKGEYIAIFDHDDISMPKRFEKQVVYMDDNPYVGVVSCNAKFMINGRGITKGETTDFPSNNLDIKRGLMRYCPIMHPGSMIRKSVLENSGVRYEAQYSPAEDYMLWIRLMEHTMFHNLKEALLKWRDFGDNASCLQREKIVDASARVTNVARRENPCLADSGCSPVLKRKEWLRLFFIIPFIKIKRRPDGRTKYYLFGFFPLLYVR